MAKITTAAQKRIITALNQSAFTAASFAVIVPDDGPNLAVIEFVDNMRYSFEIRPHGRSFEVRYSPGEVLSTDTMEATTFDNVLLCLAYWCEQIQKELKATRSFESDLEQIKREFNNKLNAFMPDSFVHLDDKEKSVLMRKLEDLWDGFDGLRGQNLITVGELNVVHSTLKDLSASLVELPKRTWYRSAGNKLLELAGNSVVSPAGQKLIAHVGEKLLQTDA